MSLKYIPRSDLIYIKTIFEKNIEPVFRTLSKFLDASTDHFIILDLKISKVQY